MPQPGILLGDGLGGFSASQSLRAGTNPFALAGADFNLDNKAALAVVSAVDSKGIVRLNQTG